MKLAQYENDSKAIRLTATVKLFARYSLLAPEPPELIVLLLSPSETKQTLNANVAISFDLQAL